MKVILLRLVQWRMDRALIAFDRWAGVRRRLRNLRPSRGVSIVDVEE